MKTRHERGATHPVNGDRTDGHETHPSPRPLPVKCPIPIIKGKIGTVGQSHGWHDDPVLNGDSMDGDRLEKLLELHFRLPFYHCGLRISDCGFQQT